jgi:[ribosomal protein S5]-alanine N-acetyltransferase
MIETIRLLIKPLSCDELRRHVEDPNRLADDMELAPSTSLSEKEAREAIQNDLLPNLIDPDKDPYFYTMWIVIEKCKKAIIGGICFHGEPDDNGEVEIGYGTDRDYMNKGYMTETINGIILWLKKNKKARIIKAVTDSSNISSLKVLEKNGFKISGQNENAFILKLNLNE